MDTLIPLILTSLEQVDEGRSIRTILRYHIQDNDLTSYDESVLYYHVFEIYRKLNLIDLYIKTSSSYFSLRKISFRMRALLRLATQLLKVEKETSESDDTAYTPKDLFGDISNFVGKFKQKQK